MAETTNQSTGTYPVTGPPPIADTAKKQADDIAEIKDMISKELRRQRFHRYFNTFLTLIVIAILSTGIYYVQLMIKNSLGDFDSLKSKIETKTDEIKNWTQDSFDDIKDRLKLENI